MVQFNFSERTIKAKVVYYGPPQSGKTTNLEQIHRISDPEGSNRLISLNTAQDRTLFFDLAALQPRHRLRLRLQDPALHRAGAGAVQRHPACGAGGGGRGRVRRGQPEVRWRGRTCTAFENMKVNLLANRLVPEKIPLVLQYNKQDLDPLIPRPELERTLNLWGRKAFPAVAARGDGVMETFVAVAQDMLAAIALKYKLKEKGLDPEAVPEIVAQAFAALVRKAPAPSPAAPSAAPPRVVIAQPEGTEPAYPGRSVRRSSPVSEELLHRAIRSNVELAEALGQVVRDLSQGLGTIHAQADQLTLGPRGRARRRGGRRPSSARSAASRSCCAKSARRRCAGRGRRLPVARRRRPRYRRPRLARTAAPPQVPPAPRTAGAAGRPPDLGPGRRRPRSSPTAPVSAAGLDGLVAEVLVADSRRRWPRARGQRGEPHRAAGPAPAALLARRAAPCGGRGCCRGWRAVVTPGTGILDPRGEEARPAPRAADGSEVKRDFADARPDPHGRARRGGPAARPQGGVSRAARGGAPPRARDGRVHALRAAPGGALETRIFLPA